MRVLMAPYEKESLTTSCLGAVVCHKSQACHSLRGKLVQV
jgi:hypothetical protein